MNQPAMTRTLAVDLRSSRLGFAVFETPAQLLDWGKRAIWADSCSALIAQLIRKYGVSVVVIRGIRRGERRDTQRVRKGLRAIRTLAGRRSTHVIALREKRFRNFFHHYGRYTKFEINALIAVVFPSLTSILPRPRKCFQPENRKMSIFDAVALGVAFLGTTTGDESVRSLVDSAAGVFSPASR
jgi:hypothetical protein